MKMGSKLLMALGCLLILCGLGTLLVWRVAEQRAQVQAAETVARIETLIPQRSTGVMDTYASMEMPVLQVDGEDFLGILQVPAFGVKLPVGSAWDKAAVTAFPRRFSGTVYDGSLVIGGADQPGQFWFLDQLQPGDMVTVTDMTGAEFTYRVDRVDRSATAEAEVLLCGDGELTLFVRDAYGLEYVLVRCGWFR